ncbi:hypothetical protein [Brasilonema sp. UFV-L1]|uniref:hypothetical protein n=1 Tax=Brasilonema sp. UFV-L1 TaxID=2234130 RepID=UPI00145EF29E|nr:hypothetical protein [Brasilonema sp. UFV-L1]NMG05773.1 hypothetical protein [Brasilonema sp. UFV-L1]
MNSIIRSNAVKTLNQTENTGMNFHNLYPDCDLVSQTAFIYKNHVTSSKEALPEAATNTHTDTVTKPQITNKDTGDWSISLQALLEQLPSTIAHLVTLRSMTFFTAVVVWTWTGKIEQVNHVRAKFIAPDEPQKIQLQGLSEVVNTALKQAQEFKTGQVVAELDTELLVPKVEVQKQDLVDDQIHFNNIKHFMARTRMLAQTRARLKAEENKPSLEIRTK